MFLSILGMYNYDNTVFERMVLPESINRDVLISMICSELAELELLYPDLETMRLIVGTWSIANLANWNKLIATTELEYNPIENYDRKEEWDDIQTTDNEGNTTTKTASYDNTQLLDTGGGLAKTKGTATNKRNGRAHGNIGVTTTQQMIEQERNVVKFNIYDYIVDSFKNRFCILVY